MSSHGIGGYLAPIGVFAALVLAGCQPAAAPGAAAPTASGGQAPPVVAAPKAQATAVPAAQSPAGATIKIGHITPRTGVLAMYGEASSQGVNLYVQQANAQGGLLGRKLEVITRDSKGQQDEAVRQARDLLLNEKVDFLVHSVNSAECLGVSDVAKEAKKILFSSCGVDEFTTTKLNHYAFRVPNITTRTQGEAAAKYAVDNIKTFKTVATLVNDYTAGHSEVDFFKAKLQQLKPDVQFIGESWPKLGETNYSPFITALQSQKPDVTFYFMASAIPFFNQAVPVNLHKQTFLLSAYWGGVDEILTLKPEAFPDGAVMGGFPWYAIDTPANTQFVDQYRSATNQPPRGSSYFEYMTMQFLGAAVKQAATTDTEKVISTLEGLETDTALGKVRLRPFDHQGASPLWVGKARWDDARKMGVLSDLVKLESEQFLPTEAEIKKMTGQ